MSRMIQIRDVPDDVHSKLKTRASRERMSLSDFIKRELERSTQCPTMEEWLEEARKSKPILAKQTAAQIIRESRDER